MKEKRHCGYCGLRSGHRYDGGCTLMLETGYLLKKEEVDDFRIKLTYRNHNIRLQSYTMHKHDAKLTQIPPKTKFLCVHGYGCIEQDGV